MHTCVFLAFPTPTLFGVFCWENGICFALSFVVFKDDAIINIVAVVIFTVGFGGFVILGLHVPWLFGFGFFVCTHAQVRFFLEPAKNEWKKGFILLGVVEWVIMVLVENGRSTS